MRDGQRSGPALRRRALFAMRDRHHAFTLDLETVLACLAMAEAEGEVPRLPASWWQLVRNRYRVG